jgi:hypothetical protein
VYYTESNEPISHAAKFELRDNNFNIGITYLTTSLLPLLCLSSPGLIRLTMISEALVSVSECVERSIQCPGQRGSRLLFKRKQSQLYYYKDGRARFLTHCFYLNELYVLVLYCLRPAL